MDFLKVNIKHSKILGKIASTYYPAIPMSDSDSSHESSKEIEPDTIKNECKKPQMILWNEEAKTQSETQIDNTIEVILESNIDKIVEYVMVIGFHHHIGSQVNSQMNYTI